MCLFFVIFLLDRIFLYEYRRSKEAEVTASESRTTPERRGSNRSQLSQEEESNERFDSGWRRCEERWKWTDDPRSTVRIWGRMAQDADEGAYSRARCCSR